MKKQFLIIIAALFLFASVSWAADTTYQSKVYHKQGGEEEVVASGGQITVESGGEIEVESGGILDVESGGYFKIAGTTVTATAAKLNMIPADGTVGQYLTTNGAGVWSWAAGTSATLDQAYDAGATITVDSGAVQLNGSHGTNNTFFINKTAGTGHGLQITNAGDGYDVNGTSGTWYVTKAGAGNFASLGVTGAITTASWYQAAIAPAASGDAAITLDAAGTGDITIGGTSTGSTLFPKAVSFTGNVDIGNAATDTLSITSVIDSSVTLDDGVTDSPSLILKDATDETLSIVKTDGDYATFTTVAGDGVSIRVGNLTVGNGTAGTASMDGEDFYVEGDSEFDGTVQFDGIVTFGNAAVTLRANEAITFTHAANGAADDLIFAQTGAQDASILLQSAGTGADAIGISASAGGVDIDAAAAQDVNIAGGQVALVSKDDAASAISLTANIGVSETIVVTNTQGTSESAITLVATAGGVNVDAAAAKDLDLAGGQVKLVSKDDAAGAISLTANIGTSETITVTNTQGTAEGAITLTSTAGGVDINAAATKNVAIDGGQVLIGSLDDAASAIALTTNVGTSETIVVTNTQGTDAAAINLTATAGGITQTVASGKAITQNGTVNYKVGSDIASPAGGELTLGDGSVFAITGTNNITSIAAASSTAGRMVILKFEAILTFTDGGNLKLAGNMTTGDTDTITLICDGTDWFEVSRSDN